MLEEEGERGRGRGEKKRYTGMRGLREEGKSEKKMMKRAKHERFTERTDR